MAVNPNEVSRLRTFVNCSYQSLSDLGLNYTGTDQDEAKTLERLSLAQAFWLLVDGHRVGTMSLHISHTGSHK
jgi:hypothetical protein